MRKSPWLMTRGDAERYVQIAQDAPTADERRGALLHLAKTRYANDDDIFDAYVSIARSDPSVSVRCAAIRQVAESRRPVATDVLAEILIEAAGSQAWMRVREDALNSLYFLQRNNAIAPGDEPHLAKLAKKILETDESRDARIAATRLLGEYQSREGLSALMGALRDPDFGVVYHAEKSLVRLTGVENGRSLRAWHAWLSETKDPFAGRPHLVEETPSRPNWWQRTFLGRKSSKQGG